MMMIVGGDEIMLPILTESRKKEKRTTHKSPSSSELMNK